MTLPLYTAHSTLPETITILDEYNAESAILSKSILSAIGTYWTQYYTDIEAVNSLLSGMVSLISQEYLNLLNLVLSSNIIDIPVENPYRIKVVVFSSGDRLRYTNSTSPIEGLSRSNPCVVTWAGHGMNSAPTDRVTFSGITASQWLSLNGINYPVTVIDDNSFSIAVDTSAFSAAYNPVTDPGVYNLIDYDEFTITDLHDMSALVNSLFEPEVALIKGTHFDIVDTNKVRFYVDIFNDPIIIPDTLNMEINGVNYILFLAVDLVLSEYSIYEKFGTFLYQNLPNTTLYKLYTTALQIFYTGNTNVSITETTLNILLGLPFCTKSGEVVTAIDTNAHTVTTSRNTYSVYPWAEVLVSEGDVLSIGTLIARWTTVNDYLSDPDWYADSRFPYELFSRFKKDVKNKNSLIVHNGRYYRNGQINYQAANTGYITDHVAGLAYAKKWFRSLRDSSQEFEVWLYEQFDAYLKYNTFTIKTILSVDSLAYYQDIRTQFLNVNKGMPSYLYPIIDTIFRETVSETPTRPTELPTARKLTKIHYYHNNTYLRNGTIDHNYIVDITSL